MDATGVKWGDMFTCSIPCQYMLLCNSMYVCRVFANKGDVWRLMNSLSDVVDGRTWPENQEPEVGTQLLQAVGCGPYAVLHILFCVLHTKF